MKKLMGEQLNHREIDEILRDVDLNGDGQVDFEGDYYYENYVRQGSWEQKRTNELKGQGNLLHREASEMDRRWW